MVGYVEGVKGYKLWNVREDKFFVSRNITFIENVFPFKEKGSHSNHENDITIQIKNENCSDVTEEEESNNETNFDIEENEQQPIQNDEEIIGSPLRIRSNRTRKPNQNLKDFVLYKTEEKTDDKKNWENQKIQKLLNKH